jgi:hypothetical protein
MAKRKRSKFGVDMTTKGKKNRTEDGITFDSDLECRYYREVKKEGIKDGSIDHCDLQIKYLLQPKFSKNGKNYLPINYVADFVIYYTNGEVLVVDTKGLPDATAKLKKKLMDFNYPDLNYIWVGYSKIDGGWLEYSELEKRKKKRKQEKTAK